MKPFFVSVAIAATLFASPAFATDCTIGQGRDITFDLAEGPNGTLFLPHTEKKNEYTRRNAIAFDLRDVLEKCRKDSNKDVYRLDGFPGSYDSKGSLLDAIEMIRQLRGLGLTAPADLSAAMTYVTEKEEQSKKPVTAKK